MNAGESLLYLNLLHAGFEPDELEVQFRLGPYRLDFAIVAERIAIEADGWVHTARTVRRRDRERDRALRGWGWETIRIDVDDEEERRGRARALARVYARRPAVEVAGR